MNHSGMNNYELLMITNITMDLEKLVVIFHFNEYYYMAHISLSVEESHSTCIVEWRGGNQRKGSIEGVTMLKRK